MPEPEILVEKRGNIAVLTLNRPERMNAWVPGMDRILEEVIPRLAEDNAVKVLVLTGAGKGFCSGADVQGWADGTDPTAKTGEVSRRKIVQSSVGLILPFRNFPRPVVGAINGVAAGAGFSLALACDLRIASDRARFASLFVKRAITPASGLSWALPRFLGPAKALEFMLTGDWIEAAEAERLGIVNRVVPHDHLMPATLELAARIAANAPLALELTKRAVYRGLENSLLAHLDLETYYQKVCFGTEDFKESVEAFLEKRPPRFQGR